MGQGTVNACEGYKMATSKFLPSLVHFVRGFAAWAVPIAGVIVATLLYYAIDVKEDEGGRTEREGLKEWIHEILK